MNKSRWVNIWAAPLIYFILIVTWLSFPKKYHCFPLDDAYIHLAYVRNLAETGSLCLNPGEPSLGTSSPLWVAILAPFYLLKLDMYWVVQILSLLFFGILCFLVTDITKVCARRLNFSESEAHLCSLLAGLLLVLNGNLHWFALSGMETMLFLVLGFLSVSLYYRRGFDYLTGIITGLLFLTRATGIILGLIFIVFDLARKRYSSVYKGLISLSLVTLPYLIISVHITGDWLPTTVQGKLFTYVDGGTDWQRIAVGSLRNNDLIRQLLQRELIQIDESNPNYFHFSHQIRNAHQLEGLLRQNGNGINGDKDIRSAILWWRLSQENRIYWYLKTLFLYQKYQSQNFAIICILFITIIAIIRKYWGRSKDFREKALSEYPECSILAVWGILHLALYAVKFRILLHHTRYLADEYVIGAVLGALGIFILCRRKPQILRLAGAVSVILTASTLLYWQNVYANNVKQVDAAYVKMANWINRNTLPDARIAAFDIGILRYIGNRYVIDLGGLADPGVHPYLEKKECGEYVRLKRADYILYSRNLEVDYFTGIFLAEYQGPMLLKQIPVVHFETPQYEAPTLTHSYRMDLNRITGWFPPTRDGILQAFSYDNRPFQPVGAMADDRLEFVGYAIDQRQIEYIPFYPYAANFTFFYRARKPLEHTYWVHTAFFNPEFNTVIHSIPHRPTHNLLPYNQWPLNRIIQEHHIRFVPSDLPRLKFRIALTINNDEFLDEAHPEKYKWFDLGTFENKGNKLNPMDHQQLMMLSLED